MSIIEKVLELISLKKEGDYWDFKLLWHTNTAELIHDILCLSNNIVSDEAFLIFGINPVDFRIQSIIGTLNRRNTNDITNILRNANFVSDIFPDCEVYTIEIENDKYIDVLHIKISKNTPYFLKQQKSDGKVHVYPYIYSRNKDSNTPIDSNANINQIEYLWKKRFGLNTKKDYEIYNIIKDFENWKFQSDNVFSLFYAKDPNYTICIKENNNYNNLEKELFTIVLKLSYITYFDVLIKYGSTTIHREIALLLDDGIILVIPKVESLFGKYKFFYYAYDTVHYDLYSLLLTKSSTNHLNTFFNIDSISLTFNNLQEKKEFMGFVNNLNLDLINEFEIIKNDYRYLGMEIEAFSEKILDLKTIYILKNKIIDFRNRPKINIDF